MFTFLHKKNYSQVISSGVLWLLNYQRPDGSFVETSAYRATPPHFPIKDLNGTADGIALTAHVLITLEQTAFMLQVGFQ